MLTLAALISALFLRRGLRSYTQITINILASLQPDQPANGLSLAWARKDVEVITNRSIVDDINRERFFAESRIWMVSVSYVEGDILNILEIRLYRNLSIYAFSYWRKRVSSPHNLKNSPPLIFQDPVPRR